MDRAEHLAWAKGRALEYVAQDDWPNAWSSLVSDLQKHPDTKGHAAIELGALLSLGGHLSSVREMREFIEGVN